MRKIYLSLLAIISVVAMLFFQNCSKTNFSSNNPNDTALIGYSLMKEVPTNGTQLSSFESVKIFLILDFSASMADEIEKVKAAINNFVEQTNPSKPLSSWYLILHPSMLLNLKMFRTIQIPS